MVIEIGWLKTKVNDM